MTEVPPDDVPPDAVPPDTVPPDALPVGVPAWLPEAAPLPAVVPVVEVVALWAWAANAPAVAINSAPPNTVRRSWDFIGTSWT